MTQFLDNWGRIMNINPFTQFGLFEGGPVGFDPLTQFIHMGRWWCRPNGGHNIRLSEEGSRIAPSYNDEIDGVADEITGSGKEAVTTIVTAPWIELDVGHSYLARVTAVGQSGVENRTSRLVREITCRKSGTPGSPTIDGSKPNAPIGVHVKPQADGSFIVYWRYDAKGQEVAPAYFNLYWAVGATPTYSTPDANVVYSADQERYNYQTGVLVGNTETQVQFVVRAGLTSDGTQNEERNTNIVVAYGTTKAPYGTIEPDAIVDRKLQIFPKREL